MSNDDIKYYMADQKLKKQLDMERKEKEESDYDTDMNRTMFQEFWGDLAEFKKKPAADAPPGHQKSKSVSRTGHLEQSKSSNQMKMGGRDLPSLKTPVPQRGHSGIQLPSLDGQAQRNNFIDRLTPDPQQMLLKTIDDQYVRPRMKFDTIMEEYLAKQAEFDLLRSGLNKVSQDSLK